MIKRLGYATILILITAIALLLRLIGIDWDQGLYLHPDERFVVWVTTDLRWPATIGEYFNTATSPLNPYNTQHDSFVYGTFPTFLVKAIAGWIGMDDYSELYLVGRAINAVFDTGTVLLTAWIGTRFFNRRAGLFAGLMLAFTPLFIQSSHFFTVDTIATFFAIAAFVCAVKSWDRSSIGWMALAGMMVGLAGASKPNSLVTIAFLALPVAEQVRRHGWRSLMPRMDEKVYPALPAVLTGGFVAFWTFRIAMPYAFTGPNLWNISLNKVWLDDLAFWRAVQTGLVDMKPSIQWIDRTPVLYILQNMVLWGMGPLLGIAALIALGLAGWRILTSRTWPSWWWLGIAGWCVANIAMYGTGIAQNQRYLMQVYPFLIVLAIGLLVELHGRLNREWIAQLLTTAVVIYTVVYGAAFSTLYIRPITRIDASEWIYDNVPAGSVLSNEYWDDALPMPLPGEDRSLYTGVTFDLYADESVDSSKVTTLVGQISQVDYIVLSSDRVIESVVRQPERYPVAVRYYEMLLSGELGFEPVAQFTQGPEILGIEWDDTSAEESLTVYEHPQVRIFKKTESYDAQHVFDEFNQALGYGGVHYIPGDPMPNQMLMSDADLAANNAADHGRFDLAREHPLLSGWLAMQVIAIAAWPLTWKAFRKLPDGGWMMSMGVGLFGMAAITLALVGWGPFEFNPTTIIISILLMLAISAAIIRRDWSAFTRDIRSRWRPILSGQGVFTLTFLGIAWLRMHQAILADEHLTILSGILHSATLPPLDPAMSGGLLHTQWAGLLPFAAIAKLLTLDVVVSYNIVIAAIGALLAGITWSLVNAFRRSWIAVLAAIAVVWGSTGPFVGGITPGIAGTSIDLQMLAILPIVALLIHTLVSREFTRYLPLAITALLAGALVVAAGWALLVTAAIVGLGLAITAWEQRKPTDPWWPTVRRFVLELVSAIGLGIAIWYPAYAAYTATARNRISATAWTIPNLTDHFGIVLLLIVLIVGVGAVQVLGETLEEGRAGIVASGIAMATLAAFIALAWSMDSSLMILLLVSLLAVIAAWHWLDHREMLWSAGLLMAGIAFLMIVQSRPFPPLPGGSSAATQLPLVAWLLFVIAIAIASGHFTANATKQVRMPLAFTSAMVMIALVIPSIMNLQREEWGTERSAITAPHLLISDGERQAANWIERELTGMPVLLTASGSGDGDYGALSAITGVPTVLGDSEMERRMRPGWNGLVDDRSRDVTTMYVSAHDWNVVSPLLQQYNVRYIVIGPTERAMFGSTVEQSFAAAAGEGHLELVYQEQGVSIYRVLPPED